MILKGKVKSGIGNFAQWIDKYNSIYEQKTGICFFPGTLNVELETPFDLPKDSLRIESHELGGPVSVNLMPCKVFDRKAYILRTDANAEERGDHPRTIIEIATDVKLRDQYHLSDGDEIQVEV